MINTILKELIELAKKWFGKRIAENKLHNSVEGRFLLLFNEHGVHKNLIPSFFGHGLSIQDVATPEKLLARLDEQMLVGASQQFGVSLEWLKGASDTIFPIQDFYKHVDEFLSFTINLKSQGKFIRAELYLSTESNGSDDAVLLIREHIQSADIEAVYRNYICGGWTHGYGKARADLVACVAILLKHNIIVRIFWVNDSVSKCAAGGAFPSALRELKRDKRVASKLSKPFRAEKWVTTPSDFEYLLAEGGFGKVTAIYRWLEHYENGYMDIGDGKDSLLTAELFKARQKELGGKIPETKK